MLSLYCACVMHNSNMYCKPFLAEDVDNLYQFIHLANLNSCFALHKLPCSQIIRLLHYWPSSLTSLFHRLGDDDVQKQCLIRGVSFNLVQYVVHESMVPS